MTEEQWKEFQDIVKAIERRLAVLEARPVSPQIIFTPTLVPMPNPVYEPVITGPSTTADPLPSLPIATCGGYS